MKAKPTNELSDDGLKLNRNDESLMTAASAAVSPIRMKVILVPIDFSTCAEKALQYAKATCEGAWGYAHPALCSATDLLSW